MVGVIFSGAEGFMIIPDYSSYYTFLGPKRTPGPKAVGEGDLANLPHLANIAYRTGRMLRFDPQKERFIGDEEANRLLTRNYRAPYLVPEKV